MNSFLKTLLTLSLCELFGFGIIESTEAQSFFIGQEYQGGFIFYIDSTGHHGLIVAPFELGYFPLLYRTEWRVEGASGLDIGTGFRNTVNILEYCKFDGETAPYYCATLIYKGYKDWFLPSIDELDQLYREKESITGGFKEGYYWSSSVAARFYGWAESFYSGDTRLVHPYARLNVRPIRAF
jgi:hypothetical protein